MKAGRKEGKNREREERKKEGRKFKKGRKTSLKILPAKTWKKLVSLNSDICGHFRQFPTVHPVSKYHSIGCSLKIRLYSQFTI